MKYTIMWVQTVPLKYQNEIQGSLPPHATRQLH